MSQTHFLKTLPVYFDAVQRGDKTFEIRKNDRDFQTGDKLVLLEHKPPVSVAPGVIAAPDSSALRELTARVSYVFHDTFGGFGLERGYVVLGLADVGFDERYGNGELANV